MHMELQDRLVYKIRSREDCKAATLEQLKKWDEQHDVEIIELVGRIDQSKNPEWISRARQAQRVLRLHKIWVLQEIANRRAAEKKAYALDHSLRNKEKISKQPRWINSGTKMIVWELHRATFVDEEFHDAVVVYQNEAGKVFVSYSDNFSDGTFEPMPYVEEVVDEAVKAC